MKGYICLFSFLCFSFAACTDHQDESPGGKDLLSTELVNNPRSASGMNEEDLHAMPTMDFKDTIHDFRDIKEGEVVTYKFQFTNNGRNPLIINNATGSCGCTAPDFPREPIPPGGNGFITVQFNSAGREGHQEKAVYISANTARASHVLHIKGMVRR